MNQLQKTLELLLIEKQEDFEAHKSHVESLSPTDRVSKGFSWNPVKVAKAGYTIGERAFVIVEKTKAEGSPHQFRAGKQVRFYTLDPTSSDIEKSGLINYVSEARMKIILNSKDLPDWIHRGPLGVDLSFDERSYLEMEKAMKMVMEAKGNRLAELRSILTGKQPARFQEIDQPIHIPSLNTSQNQAVNTILAAREVAIVHGPPGTGKTTTLVEAVRLLSEREHTVLVTAPSNAAVDWLTLKLAEKSLNTVRVGNIARVDESIISHTLEARVATHPDNKHLKKVKIQAAELRRKAKKYRRKFGSKEKGERRQLFREAGELSAWANQLEDRIIDQVLSAAQVITCTLVGANHPVLEKRTFRTAVIDEAAQALEPASWIPITKVSKVIMAGDPHQLPPTIKSLKAAKNGLSQTLLEKCIGQMSRINLLNIQYRMHKKIMQFSNQQFYNNVLKADKKVANELISTTQNHPVEFIDTAGCGFEEQVHPEYLSKFNPGEFNILREHLYQLIDGFGQNAIPPIGIISPYREQVIYIKKNLLEEELFVKLPISIDTIDAFQGQEREIIYISLARSNEKSEIGFLKDYRRMNVAMTRAKKKLVIIGDSSTIGGDHFYGSFLDFCEKEGNYSTAWEYMYQ